MSLPFEPQTGDIIFTTQGSPLSYLIRLRQQDFDYSHVLMVGRPIEDGCWTALTTGGQKKYWFGEVDLEDYLKDKTYIVQRVKGNLNDAQKEKLYQTGKTLVGTPYNTAGLLKLATMGLFKAGVVHSIFKPPLRFPFEKMRSFFCSQSVAYCYWVGAGIQLNTRAAKVDPSAYDLDAIYYADQTEDVYQSP